MSRRVHRILWLLFAATGVLVLLSLPNIWADLVYPLPTPIADNILASSEEFNVSPSLVAGVIYVESHYNPKATSRVGARGLMQIMPATARGISNRLSDVGFTEDKLYEPATNIRYGTFYLHELLDGYGNNLDLVLAAYNGGGAVANRLAASGTSAIPLETASFIVKVKHAQETYARLYGEDLGSHIGDDLRQEEPVSLWDRIFGRLFKR